MKGNSGYLRRFSTILLFVTIPPMLVVAYASEFTGELDVVSSLPILNDLIGPEYLVYGSVDGQLGIISGPTIGLIMLTISNLTMLFYGFAEAVPPGSAVTNTPHLDATQRTAPQIVSHAPFSGSLSLPTTLAQPRSATPQLVLGPGLAIETVTTTRVLTTPDGTSTSATTVESRNVQPPNSYYFVTNTSSNGSSGGSLHGTTRRVVNAAAHSVVGKAITVSPAEQLEEASNKRWLAAKTVGNALGGINGNIAYETMSSSSAIQSYIEAATLRYPNVRSFSGVTSIAFRIGYIGLGAYLGGATGIWAYEANSGWGRTTMVTK